MLLSGWVDFHKGGVNLDEGGVWGFGIAIEGERTGKERVQWKLSLGLERELGDRGEGGGDGEFAHASREPTKEGGGGGEGGREDGAGGVVEGGGG